MPLLTGVFSTSYGWGRSGGPTNFLEIIVGTVLLVSCQDIVTLTATVLSDTEGHTYFWQQIRGPAVTWLEPQNQTDVTFQMPSGVGNNDLTFRFWVDKDTPYEQYRDLIVTSTARDDLPTQTSIASTGGITQFTSIMNGVTNTNIQPNLSTLGSVTVNNVNRTLVWTNPTPTYPVVYTKTELYTNVGGTLTLLATLNSPISSYQNLLTNQPNTVDNYVYRSYYDLYNAGQFTGYVDVTANYSNLVTMDASDTVGGFDVKSETRGSTSYFQTQIVTLEGLNCQDNLEAIDVRSGVTGSTTIFQVQIVSLTQIPDVLQDTVTSSINTRTPGSITIFQIQLSDGITVI